MGKRKSLLFALTFFSSSLLAQFGSVEVNFETRLLRSEEKQDIINLKNGIIRFFTTTTWDESYSDLTIPVHIWFRRSEFRD